MSNDEQNGAQPDNELAGSASLIEHRIEEALDQLFEGKDVRPDRRTMIRVVQQIVGEYHEGPMPAPRTMADYEKVLPGLAGQIAKQALVEQEHRHAMEREDRVIQRQIITESAKYSTKGLWVGLTSTIALFAIGFVLALTGHDPVAETVFGSWAIGIAVFVSGRKFFPGLARQDDESARKD